MSDIVITANDQISPDLARLAQLLGDLAPAMAEVRARIFLPMAAQARAQAPAKSGNLRQSIKSWSKNNAAGLGIYEGPDNLGRAKAALLLKGAQAHKFKKRESYQVKLGRAIYTRENPGSPWGRIKKRSFFPGRNAFMGESMRIELVIAEFLRNAVEGQ